MTDPVIHVSPEQEAEGIRRVQEAWTRVIRLLEGLEGCPPAEDLAAYEEALHTISSTWMKLTNKIVNRHSGTAGDHAASAQLDQAGVYLIAWLLVTVAGGFPGETRQSRLLRMGILAARCVQEATTMVVDGAVIHMPHTIGGDA